MRMTLALAAASLLAAGPALAGSDSKRIWKLIAAGQWFTAGELAREALARDPQDAKTRELLSGLDRKARQDAENLDFDPRRYFYAQGYLDYFERRRYQNAVEALEQVLTFELENEEALRFMDKSSVKAEEEAARLRSEQEQLLDQAAELRAENRLGEALTAAERAVAMDARSARARDLVAALQRSLEPPPLKPYEPAEAAVFKPLLRQIPAKPSAPVRPPPDPGWLESRYREALKAYVRKDLVQASAVLSELVDRDPKNERWRKALARVRKEAPEANR